MPLRPPSRVEPLSFPTFAMSWWGDAGNGRNVVAYVGGGGSSKTGIFNCIVAQLNGFDKGVVAPEPEHPLADECDDFRRLTLSTGDLVGVGLQVYQNPLSHHIWLVVALANQVQRYSLPEGQKAGAMDVGEAVNAVAANVMADRLAVGCESGRIHVYGMSDEDFHNQPALYTLEGHDKTVCACQFSARHHRLVSSAKDGTARVWEQDSLVAVLQCTVEEDDSAKKPAPKGRPRKPPQILVRGCAFADLDGRVALTVASARRGKAVLSQWVQRGGGAPAPDAPSPFECVARTDCSPVPISAMSLSGDAGLLALGSVDGSILLWDVAAWKLLKKFPEVHGLPVTCIAARPFPVPLAGEEDSGVEIHARSASADSQLACLTMQRRAPRNKKATAGYGAAGSLNPFAWMRQILLLGVIAWAIYPVILETREKCMGSSPLTSSARASGETYSLPRCILDHVLLAPHDRPGVGIPPY